MLAETRNVPHVKNALFNYTTHEVRNTTLLPTTTEYHPPYCLLYYLLRLNTTHLTAYFTTYLFNYTTHEV